MDNLFSKFRTFLTESNLNLSDYIENGTVDLYHFTRVNDVDSLVLDPQYFVHSRGSFSRNEWKVSRYPRTFFYTNPQNKESIITGELFSTKVPADQIYDLKRDPEGFMKKHKHPMFGLRNDLEWTEMLKDIHSKYKGVFYSIGEPDIVAWFEPIEVNKIS